MQSAGAPRQALVGLSRGTPLAAVQARACAQTSRWRRVTTTALTAAALVIPLILALPVMIHLPARPPVGGMPSVKSIGD
jgi:hypothetical protein